MAVEGLAPFNGSFRSKRNSGGHAYRPKVDVALLLPVSRSKTCVRERRRAVPPIFALEKPVKRNSPELCSNIFSKHISVCAIRCK